MQYKDLPALVTNYKDKFFFLSPYDDHKVPPSGNERTVYTYDGLSYKFTQVLDDALKYLYVVDGNPHEPFVGDIKAYRVITITEIIKRIDLIERNDI